MWVWGAMMESVLEELRECLRAHDEDSRVLGNVRAGDLAALLLFLHEKWDERDAAVNQVLDQRQNMQCMREEIARLRKVLRLILEKIEPSDDDPPMTLRWRLAEAKHLALNGLEDNVP